LNADLKTQIQNALNGRVVIVGVGNTDLGDDGFGVRMAEELEQNGVSGVIVADTTPERWVGRILDGEAQHVVLLDAVETQGVPGSAMFVGAAEMKSLYPQISTHKMALSSLARLIETMSGARVWLLGVKPQTLRGNALSETVKTSLEALKAILVDCLAESASSAEQKEGVAS
jgi:hydrogenase maturation protease